MQNIVFLGEEGRMICHLSSKLSIVKGHSEKLTFLSLSIAIKHSAFPLTKLSVSEVPAILKKFVLKEATLEAAILKLSWQPTRVYVTSFRLT